MMLVPRRNSFDLLDDFFEDDFFGRKERNLMKTDIREKDIITIIYGKDVDEEELAALTEHIEATYSNVEVDTINGGQNVYSYILSIE